MSRHPDTYTSVGDKILVGLALWGALMVGLAAFCDVDPANPPARWELPSSLAAAMRWGGDIVVRDAGHADKPADVPGVDIDRGEP